MLKIQRSLLLAGMLISTNASADQVTLKNGDRLTGEIIKSDEKPWCSSLNSQAW